MQSGRGGRRVGAGRPKGTTKAGGLPTKAFRLSAEFTKEQYEALPSLIALVDFWDDECAKNPDNPRHHFLKQMIEEIKGLGY